MGTFIRGLTGLVKSGPIIIADTNNDLSNVVINNFVKPGMMAKVANATLFYWDPTSTSTPSTTVLVANDGTPGRWLIFNTGGSGGSGAVIFDGGSASQNARTARSANQSLIDNTKNGIINLSSRTTGSSAGAIGNYTTISGGDQNTASGDYSTISGGLINSATATGASVIGGSNNTASGTYSVASGNASVASGSGSQAQGLSSTALRTGEQSQASGKFTSVGDAQTTVLTMFGAVTNALTEIFVDGSAERILVPANAVFGFKIMIATYANTSKIAAYWEFSGGAKTNAGGVLSLIGSIVDKVAVKDDATWDADVDAVPGPTGYIRVRVKGAAGNVNHAIARVELTQIKF